MAPSNLTPLVPKPQAPRYRRGKLPSGLPVPSDSSDDDDGDDDDERGAQDVRSRRTGGEEEGKVAGGAGRVLNTRSGVVGKKNIQVALRDTSQLNQIKVGQGEDERDEESTSSEESSEEEETPATVVVKPTSRKPGQPLVNQDDDEDEDEDNDEEESEEESESEEEEKVKMVYRPTFVAKTARTTLTPLEIQAQAELDQAKKRQEEEEIRKRESRGLLGETLRREMVVQESTTNAPDLDDTDDLDPSAEFDAWRLRELSRLARDKEQTLLKEAEREEIERRRALPEAQRLREDEEYARKTREAKLADKEERGFLDRFYHKGAFHQDEEIVKRRLGQGEARLEGSVDVGFLPKVMQVKNFGKASRSKYTHLKDQDTTQEGWDRALRRGPVGLAGGLGGQGQNEGCFNCGGRHLRRDCPNPPQGAERTGSNTSAIGGGGGRGQGLSTGGYDRERGPGLRGREDGRGGRTRPERGGRSERK